MRFLRPALFGWLLLTPAAAVAQLPQPVLPAHFETEVLVSGLEAPTDLVSLAGGRLLVAQQSGIVRGFAPDGTPEGVVVSLWSEVAVFADRGLVAIQVHPGFVPDGGDTSWLYLYYAVGKDQLNGTDGESSFGRLTRYRVHEVVEGDLTVPRAILGSRQILLGEQLPDGTAPTAVPILHESHQGGSLVFGDDGSLLLSTGDGADIFQVDFGGLHPYGFDDFVNPITGLKGPIQKSQDIGTFRSIYLDSLSGKVLRLDPATGFGLDSNPFFDGDPASLRSRVWAMGLRNGFRMAKVPGTGSSDPSAAQPGWLVIGDVGSTSIEELSLCKGGENFGWPCFEATQMNEFAHAHVHPSNPYGWPDCNTAPVPASPPLVKWHRDLPGNMKPLSTHQTLDGEPLNGFLGICVIGGTFYEGASYPPVLHGRYFFGDFGFEWLKALALDGTGAVQQVADVGELVSTLVAVKNEADTGDLLVVQRGYFSGTSRVMALRYGANQAPALSLDVATTDDPLRLDFDASATTDADGDTLVFTWDFGDGSPLVEGATASHTFAAPALYQVTLRVFDGFETAELVQPVLPGFLQPTVAIASPVQGQTFEKGEPILLSGIGFDGQGGALDLVWSIDVFVDGNWIPDAIVVPAAQAELPFVSPGGDGTDFGFRLRLLGGKDGTVLSERSVHVHPAARVVDVAGPASFETKVLSLDPPGSQGFGNRDPEIWRDRKLPEPGSDLNQQYATYHPQAVFFDANDWVGYRFGQNHPAGARVFAVELREGAHVPQGGWFKNPKVELLLGGTWQPASGVTVTPEHPGDVAGEGYTTYRFAFDPVAADGVRVIGRPGGNLGFVSVSELRVFAVAPPAPLRDVTDLAAAPIASTLAFAPAGPQSFGSANLELLRDGAEPEPSSTSPIAQVSSYHPADPGGPAWFGWRFDDATTVRGLRYREGLVWSSAGSDLGGWLQNVRVEWRLDAGAPWQTVGPLEITPPYRTVGPGTPSYEAYHIDFQPVVLREVRVIGTAGGQASFATASELRVFGPHGFDGGWIERQGLGLISDVLTLGSTTPPVLGNPILLEVSGAGANTPGVLAFSPTNSLLPVQFGTFLVDVPSAQLLPLAFDGDGRGRALLSLPSTPALAGKVVSFQAFSIDSELWGFLGFSNGLDAVLSAE